MARSESPFGIPIERKGLKSSFLRDFYHHVLKASWLQFLAVSTSLYLLINCFFAYLYYIGGDSILNAELYSYWEAFVFSFQTSSTIGYGYYQPATGYAHAIVVLDTLSGITFVAITTGLAFAKFSRPTANVIFSDRVLITRYDGKKTLLFRVANARNSHIVDASIEVTALLSQKTQEGHEMRRLYDLDLVRKKSPVFFLSWTVMHELDDESPIAGLTDEDMREKELGVMISLTGVDALSSQLVHAHHYYRVADIQRDHYFAGIIDTGGDGVVRMDYSKFHETVKN